MSKFIEKTKALPQITLKSLYQNMRQHPKQMKSMDTHLSNAHQHDIKVLSPFYVRNKCNSNVQFCKCPFHRRERLKKVPLVNMKKKDKRQSTGKIQMKKTLTQKSQKEIQKIKEIKTFLKKENRQLEKYIVDDFHQTDHKVQCRNFQFQEYLKKNQLYILNGKKHTRLKSQGVEDGRQSVNHETANKSIDTVEKYNDKKKNFKKNPLKSTQKKILTSFERIMKMGMKERLKYYEELTREIKDQETKYLEMKKNQIINKKNEISSFYEEEIKHSKKEQNEDNLKVLKGLKLLLHTILGSIIEREKKKNQLKTKKNHSREKSGNQCSQISDQSSFVQKQDENFDNFLNLKENQQKEEDEDSNENFWPENQGRRNERRLTKLVLNKNKTCYGDDQFLSSQEEDEMLDEVMMLEKERKKYGLNEYRKSRKSKKEEKGEFLQKIKGIKEKEKTVNLKELRRNIEKNRNLISTVQSALANTELEKYIIKENDSLITRKKKMRYLKELLYRKKNSLENITIYSEIIDYLNLQNQHNDQIIKRHKTEVVPDENQREIKISDLFNKRDFVNQLKFIQLEESKDQHEDKVEEKGWIKIPQFVTYDLKATSTKVENKRKKMTEEVADRKTDEDLVQVQLGNKFSLNSEMSQMNLASCKLRSKKQCSRKVELRLKESLLGSQKK